MRTIISFHHPSLFKHYDADSMVAIPRVGEIVSLTKIGKPGNHWSSGKYVVEKVEHEFYLDSHPLAADWIKTQSVAIFVIPYDDKTTIKNNKNEKDYNYDDHNRRRDR